MSEPTISLKSSSSLRTLPFLERLRYWMKLLRMSIAGARNKPDFTDLQASYLQHDECARQYLGRPLTACKVVEIGYGARPNRLIWFRGQGVDITGIDLDQPILFGRPLEFLRVYRKNGWERALKSVGRWLIGERHLRRALLDELSRQQGKRFPLPAASLEVGDAADAGYWARHREAEYIFSEDVFEHIPAEALPRLVAMIAGSMHPKGIAVIKPMIYTGICGGHHLEWFPHTHNQPTQRRTGPWEHLRQNRYPADTYLNRLTRADYRKLIAQNFDILEETVAVPGMGSQFMTPEIRDELRAYSDEELYSNSVRFVLRPRS